jgi:hypothetical protein
MAPFDETLSTERIIIFALAAVRAGTLVLGALQLGGATARHAQPMAATAFAIVGTTSIVGFVRAARRTRQSRLPALDVKVAMAETIAGLIGLVLLGAATPVNALVGAEFWMLPYTVATVVLVAAACPRTVLAMAAALALGGGYLYAVSPALTMASTAGQGVTAAALDNAFSYPGFCVLGLIMIRLYRFVTREVALLRRLAAASAAERGRLEATRAAYRLGHDYPKAYLRELRRAERPPADLRAWATRFREDFLASLSADPRTGVDFGGEIASVVATFAAAMPVRLDVEGLAGNLPGVPALVVAEAVRECLNNAAYHCYGSAVTVTAVCPSTDSTLTVTVHDDGPGCNPEQVMASWALKQNAVHLVEAAGGGYAVDSGPGGGTTIRLTFPIRDGSD